MFLFDGRRKDKAAPTGLSVLANAVHPASHRHDWYFTKACMPNVGQSCILNRKLDRYVT